MMIMEVFEVKPHGYCQGVMDAIKLALKAKEENPDRTCFLLGGIVHNEDTIRFFEERGFIILNEKKASLDVLISSIPDGEVVIFSAHGHAKSLEDIAKKKQLIIYDATCPFVTANMRLASSKHQRDIVYVGVKGHLEAEGFLANVKTAGFYDTDRARFEAYKENIIAPLVIGQTTLSKKEFDDAYAFISMNYPGSEAGLSRCRSTTNRQEALRNAAREGGTVIVLGSKTSNNTRKLYEIGIEEGRTTYLVLGLDELKTIPLEKERRIVLCSGASTSKNTFDECLDYLKSI